MEVTKSQKSIIWIFVLVVILILLVIIFKKYISNEDKLSNKIMWYIDNNCYNSNTCILSMKEITDFEWDKMLMYQVGSSNTEISDLLGVEFKDSIDLSSGIIFIVNNKIVYEEHIFYHPEKPYKLLLYVGRMYGQPKYGVYTPNNAVFDGSRTEINGNFYYKIAPSVLDK